MSSSESPTVVGLFQGGRCQRGERSNWSSLTTALVGLSDVTQRPQNSSDNPASKFSLEDAMGHKGKITDEMRVSILRDVGLAILYRQIAPQYGQRDNGSPVSIR